MISFLCEDFMLLNNLNYLNFSNWITVFITCVEGTYRNILSRALWRNLVVNISVNKVSMLVIHKITNRVSFPKLAKNPTTHSIADNSFVKVSIRVGHEQRRRHMVGGYIQTLIFIWLLKVRPLKMPEFSRSWANPYLTISMRQHFLSLRIWRIEAICSLPTMTVTSFKLRYSVIRF